MFCEEEAEGLLWPLKAAERDNEGLRSGPLGTEPETGMFQVLHGGIFILKNSCFAYLKCKFNWESYIFVC
jgi:hypothetical protein